MEAKWYYKAEKENTKLHRLKKKGEITIKKKH